MIVLDKGMVFIYRFSYCFEMKLKDNIYVFSPILKWQLSRTNRYLSFFCLEIINLSILKLLNICKTKVESHVGNVVLRHWKNIGSSILLNSYLASPTFVSSSVLIYFVHTSMDTYLTVYKTLKWSKF